MNALIDQCSQFQKRQTPAGGNRSNRVINVPHVPSQKAPESNPAEGKSKKSNKPATKGQKGHGMEHWEMAHKWLNRLTITRQTGQSRAKRHGGRVNALRMEWDTFGTYGLSNWTLTGQIGHCSPAWERGQKKANESSSSQGEKGDRKRSKQR